MRLWSMTGTNNNWEGPNHRNRSPRSVGIFEVRGLTDNRTNLTRRIFFRVSRLTFVLLLFVLVVLCGLVSTGERGSQAWFGSFVNCWKKRAIQSKWLTNINGCPDFFYQKLHEVNFWKMAPWDRQRRRGNSGNCVLISRSGQAMQGPKIIKA